MDRKRLYAQFHGDEVDGNVYALGDPLNENTDAGTVAYLESTGRWASTKPGDDVSIPDSAAQRAPKDMSRAEMLAELGGDMDDAVLREAIEKKRAQQADERGEGTGEDTGGDPLDGNADAAITYVGGLSSVDDLTAAKARETDGKKRSTVLAAIDKRVEALNAA